MKKARYKKNYFIRTTLTLILLFIFAELATYASFLVNKNSKLSYSYLSSRLNNESENNTNVLGAMAIEPDYMHIDALHPYLGFVRNFDLKNKNVNSKNPAILKSYTANFNQYGFVGQNPISKKSKDKLIIGLFGGSVAESLFNLAKNEFIDNLHSYDKFKDKKIEILDLALGGYKQPQQLMAFNYILTLGGSFDVIVNLDGFNEIALPYTENRLNKINPVYPRQWSIYSNKGISSKQLMNMATAEKTKEEKIYIKNIVKNSLLAKSYTVLTLWNYLDLHLSNSIYQQQKLLNESINNTDYSFQKNGPIREYPSEEAYLNDSVKFWENSSYQMHNLAEGNNILYLHFLQPNQYVSNSKPFTSEEEKYAFFPKNLPEKDTLLKTAVQKGYPLLIKEGDSLIQEGVSFYDLTQIFANDTRTIYIDTCCHYNKLGYEIIADKIAYEININYPEN